MRKTDITKIWRKTLYFASVDSSARAWVDGTVLLCGTPRPQVGGALSTLRCLQVGS